LLWRKISERDHARHAPGRCGYRLRMRDDDRTDLRNVAGDAQRNVARWRDDALRAVKESPEGGAPFRDVEAPLAGPSRQACRAARGVGLSAISAILGHEVVLRANGVIVVQRAVVRNADVRGKIQYGARQTMDMVVMHTRHADLSKQRGEHGIVVRQGKV